MMLEDEVAAALSRRAEALEVGPVPLERILRRGRARRVRRWAGTAGVVVALAAGVTVPLVMLSGIREGVRPSGPSGVVAETRLLFISQEDRDYRIVAMNPDGSELQTLPIPLPSLSDPTWSPDGKKIAFSGGEQGNTEPADIYVANADGSGLTRLTFDSEVPDWQPAWSPDSKRIVFSRYELGHYSLFTVDVETLELRRLTENNFGVDQDPSWSPDGEIIVFSRNADGTPSIYTIRPDGSDLTRITHPQPGSDSAPVWSTDRSKIAFSRATDQNDGTRDIYVMNADGTNIERLTHHPAEDGGPAWSPDGTAIAFLSNRAHPNPLPDGLPESEVPPLGRYDVRRMEVYLMAADGSEERRLTFDARAGYSPFGFALNWRPGP